jgi:hypothetical protein
MTDPSDSGSPQGDLQEIIRRYDRLSADINAAEKIRRVKERTMIALLAIGVVLIVVMGFGMVKLFQIAENSQKAAEQSARTAATIEDCTVPAGSCYRDGSKRTGGAVGNILKGQVAVAECLKEVESSTEVQACMDRKLNVSPKP